MDVDSVIAFPWLQAGLAASPLSNFGRAPSPPSPAPTMALTWRGPGTTLTLEPESEVSDMDESVHSEQMYMTASCHDTEDTETSSGETEFSVVSSASASDAGFLPEISSGPEDDVLVETQPPAGRRMCIQCRAPVSSPFLHCRRCYNDRKRFLPPRPIPHNRKRRRSATEASGSASSKECSSSYSAEDESFQSQCEAETLVKPSVCAGCMNAPCNGVFVHGNLAHQVFCYRCSQRIWLERKLCPYCNRRIKKVVKLFKVEMD